MSKNYLIIDQGGHSTRAIIFDSDGKELATSAIAVATLFPQPAFAEQDSKQVLLSLDNCLLSLAEKLSSNEIEAIQSAALIVQRSSFLACRKSDLQPLTNIISWQDTRNQALINQLHATFNLIRIKTGLRANAHYGATKMRWLLDNDRNVQQAAANNDLLFVPLAAYLAARLVHTTTVVVDPVIASRTLLCELGSMQWSAELLQLFGIQSCYLPSIVASDYPVGHISMADKHISLKLVGGDQSFIAFSSGIHLLPTDLFVNVGTGAFIQTLIDSEQSDIDDNLLCSPAVITQSEKILMAEGTINAAASALEWLWQHENVSMTYSEVDAALLAVKAPPLFINTVSGTGSPYWLAYQPPRFIGDSDNLVEKAVAVVESIVFALMDNVVLLIKNKPEINRIMLSGGFSRYDGFCQKLANLTAINIVRPKDHEASARGAAIYLMQKNIDAEDIPADQFLVQSDNALKQRYQHYQQIISSY